MPTNFLAHESLPHRQPAKLLPRLILLPQLLPKMISATPTCAFQALVLKLLSSRVSAPYTFSTDFAPTFRLFFKPLSQLRPMKYLQYTAVCDCNRWNIIYRPFTCPSHNSPSHGDRLHYTIIGWNILARPRQRPIACHIPA